MYTHTDLPIEKKPKLVRDKIPELIEKNEPVKALTKVLSEEEYKKSLIEKLHEETEELALALRDNTNPIVEMADIMELLNAASLLVGSSLTEVEMERLKKLEKRGGFSKRLMLIGKEKLDQTTEKKSG